MQTYEGQIDFLGNSTHRSGKRTYTMIRIGGVELNDVTATDHLDNYLQMSLNDTSEQKTTLYFYKFPLAATELIGMRHGRSLGKRKPVSVIVLALMAIIGLVTLPFGLLLFYGVYALARYNSAIGDLH